jgi:DNA-binding MarR family transcriptional regulator
MNDSIAFLIIQAAHRIEGRLEEALAGASLSGPRFAALNVLAAQGQPTSLSELAEKLTCVRSNVTQLVDRLEAEGLVRRTDDPADRRAVRAELTRLGRERHASGEKVFNKVLREVTRELSDADEAALRRALEALA